MLRRALFACAGVVVAAFLVADHSPKASAADPDLTGNWVFTYSPRASNELAIAIIKIETKDGKPSASVVHVALKGTPVTVSKLEVNGKTIKFATSLGFTFEGTLEKDTALGNFSSDQVQFRAKLARTDKTELTAAEATKVVPPPAPMAEAQKLTTAVAVLRGQAAREPDAEKKKELLDKVDAAQKEADEKAPALLRETVAKHGDTPFALDAAVDLIRGAAKYKVTADEAAKLLAAVEKAAAPYGPRYARTQVVLAVELLAAQKETAGAAEIAAAKLVGAFTDADPAEYQARVLTARKLALEALGKADDAKAVAMQLARLEAKIDAEYLKKVPPFKPTPYAGRKEKNANQVVVMELFTGAQCPPCVAADVAFDALLKAYKPTDLVLIQYHMHIPGPDPLTNKASEARWAYYREQYPMEIRGTPSTLFNGKPQAAGGGGMANAESKYKQYASIIDDLLESSTDVKVGGKATRKGDKIDIAVEVTGGDNADYKLRLIVVEENVKYTGGNNLRFHHQVVRAMPGGPEGVAIKDKTFRHTASADVVEVRKELTKYLDDYAKTRAFPKPDRPMEMKNVKVIALVQNDKTKAIVQAAQIEVEGKAGGGQ